MEKETIEQASTNYANYNQQMHNAIKEAVKFGAKWQQEQNLLMHEMQKDKLVFESLRKTYEKQKENFAVGFADWITHESVCFPEHKDKSIEELLEIYKKEKAL